MPTYTAYELTLIIELMVYEKSNQETAKLIILCVHAGLAYMYLAWNKSSHSALHEVNMPINYK